MAWAILDTSIYVGHWEHGRHTQALEEVGRAFVVRHSAVVLSELRRGARTRRAERLVMQLRKRAHVCWAPTLEDWWDTGRLVRVIGDARSWDTAKRREFQNDALIALTAQRHGATVVTANGADFGLLARYLRVSIWALGGA